MEREEMLSYGASVMPRQEAELLSHVKVKDLVDEEAVGQPKIGERHPLSTTEAQVQVGRQGWSAAFEGPQSQTSPVENVLLLGFEQRFLPQLPLQKGNRCLLLLV